jgi:putative membrane protein
MEPAAAYLHFFSIMLLTASLVTQFVLCSRDLQPPHVQTLARIDILYLSAAVLALATGLARLFLAGKGASFYFMNPMFYIKIALFLAVGLVSVMPTLQFIRWNRALKTGEGRAIRDSDIQTARRYIALELLLLAFIPLAAVVMARGIGLQPQ